MYPVSQRFLDSLDGSHEMVARARILEGSRQFSLDPVGQEVPILDGDVKISRTADVKRTLSLTIPGEYWDLVQPYGNEVFVERGIDFGDGTQEYVPLGYFRIQDVEQDRAPRGPITLDGRDRNAQLLDHRRPYPIALPSGATHRQVFQALLNAQLIGGDLFAYLPWGSGGFSVTLPITWTGYNPDTVTLNGTQVWEQSAYEFLAKLAESLESVLVFVEDGSLEVALRDAPLTEDPVWTVRAGEGGNLLRTGRKVTRDGVYNSVTAYGSDPAAPTGYQIANNASGGPLQWNGLFGHVMRYYASPLLRTGAQATAAAGTVLGRYSALPLSSEIEVVPNPALRPNDLVRLEPIGMDPVVRQVDTVTIPLVNGPTSTLDMITEGAYVPDPGEVGGL